MTEQAAAIEIRAVERAEWPLVLACGEPFFQEKQLPGLFDPAHALATWAMSADLFPAVIVAAFVGGQVVGAIGRLIVPDDWSSHRYAAEAFWYVLPAYRRMSVGVRMLALADAWADEQGVTDKRLGAFHGESFEHFREAYARLGYRPYTTQFRKVEG